MEPLLWVAAVLQLGGLLQGSDGGPRVTRAVLGHTQGRQIQGRFGLKLHGALGQCQRAGRVAELNQGTRGERPGSALVEVG